MPTSRETSTKWDNAVAGYDFMNSGVELRYGTEKRDWFSRATGRILLAAVGTGLDLPYFSKGQNVVGIDISSGMLEKAAEKIAAGDGSGGGADIVLVRGDIERLGFGDETFDTVVTSCTFCSVPDPIGGLKELLRVLKRGGNMLMFEHVRSGIFWMGPMMDLLTKVTRLVGPDLNRRTGRNIRAAGFELKREVNIYLDMVKLFEAARPPV